ncbi:NAD(P)/FAD-dependent oxidoreductase [Phanerochaete sordida]|uniref:NAD(P)/FAD-dependent oxidoreductase n=1 Tax=Phanerochaete sordida TaxID=48140 RepID=A0A9P3GKZ8_9APHY|nr:NAD(P)/FAD-dependent oxidoreductase [Phanerochaete sordida]
MPAAQHTMAGDTGHVEHPSPNFDDDYFARVLPTFDSLGATPPENPDAQAIARNWVASLATHSARQDAPGLVAALLHPAGWWRDLFALTWDLRSFAGAAAVAAFLADCLPARGLGDVALQSAEHQAPFPGLAWVLVRFAFGTRVAAGRGTARLVYGPDGAWRAFAVSTQLDELKSRSERLGDRRDFRTEQGDWEARRAAEREFADKDPEVLVVGAGHGGLGTAAHLKHLDVSCLVVERNERVGDNWRNRYDSLTLHDPIWTNHMPYLPFPPSWPVFSPARKIANWFESYVDALDLNVWTSAEALSAARDEHTKKWDVRVRRADGSERVLHVDNVVLAQGYTFKNVVFPGQEEFQGRLMHSTQYRSAKGLDAKKVVIMGACTSAHDIASDCVNHGIGDVTMIQRSSTYIISSQAAVRALVPASTWEHRPCHEIELDNFSMSFKLQSPLHTRVAAVMREMDRELLDDLARTGYRVKNGAAGDRGLFHLLFGRGGGYYLDTGACAKIIDGKIRVKSGSEVARITPTGVALADGTELPADVIVVATGVDCERKLARKLLGPTVGGRVPDIWGLNAEGELRGSWHELDGLDNMWFIHGNFATCRFYSKLIALQIKAKQEGIFGPRYAPPSSP